eukprot:CAMPEP_0195019698 /NCGR_PEP_ID=MMETSP0326_2-20130528/33392_1 /TAXON_ID=2866 ORGANISM="Crypthecodinium cohnii, Strain Seligo" /NCGR_SAMPLE_ID=MMETSP0326_2 /ASSEMBLY_ACC=CAM_ASM_000348 /LENGTH=44 /DNA_ID= /DNA_START= /DNA_END= /DNA_ORIENTATION=
MSSCAWSITPLLPLVGYMLGPCPVVARAGTGAGAGGGAGTGAAE